MKNKQYIIPVIITLLLTVSLFMPWYSSYTEMDFYDSRMTMKSDNYLTYMNNTIKSGEYETIESTSYDHELITPEYREIYYPIIALCIGAVISSLFVILFVYKKVDKLITIFSGITTLITLSTVVYLVLRIETLFSEALKEHYMESTEYNLGFISYVNTDDMVWYTYPNLGWFFVLFVSVLSIVLVYQSIKKKNDIGPMDIIKVE